VHCNAADVAVEELALAGVQPAAHRETKLPDSLDDLPGAPARPRRAVEGGYESVAYGLDLAASEKLESLSYEGVVSLQKLPPRPIADLGGAIGRGVAPSSDGIDAVVLTGSAPRVRRVR
jgi:hypothetical protein